MASKSVPQKFKCNFKQADSSFEPILDLLCYGVVWSESSVISQTKPLHSRIFENNGHFWCRSSTSVRKQTREATEFPLLLLSTVYSGLTQL